MSKEKEIPFKNKMFTSWEPEWVISSGSILLDHSPALSNYKGIPSGSMIQLSSSGEGSFKTSWSLQGLAEIQKNIGKVALIDAEHGVIGTSFLENFGLSLDEDKWTLFEPDSGEEAFSMVEYCINNGYKGIVLDSIDATTPQKMLDGDFGDETIGLHAKLVTRAIRKFSSLIREHQCIIWFVNQRKINFTPMGPRGTKQTGGDGINFYCHMNIEMRKLESDSQLIDKDIIPLRLAVRRSKLGSSYMDIDTYAKQGVGIDRLGELVELAIGKGLIKRAGSWWKTTEGETLGQGIDAARSWVIDNENLILE